MKLFCPKCTTMVEVGADVAGCITCPTCSETLDVSALRSAVCPICGCGFEDGEEVRICPDCKTPHHGECWAENHGCSTYGCSSAAHQETHTTDGVSSGLSSGPDGESATRVCPACGALLPATDLVCGKCGKLLGDNLPGDSAWTRIREAAGRNLTVAKENLMPRLVRNFRMLGHDIAAVFRLWWGEFARYVDFHGRTSRKSLAAFLAVCFAGFLATFDSLFFRVILYIVLAMPLAACCVRRLRDTDMSPWMAFAIPLLPFLLLVPTVKESDDVQPSGDDQSKESSNDIV